MSEVANLGLLNNYSVQFRVIYYHSLLTDSPNSFFFILNNPPIEIVRCRVFTGETGIATAVEGNAFDVELGRCLKRLLMDGIAEVD